MGILQRIHASDRVLLPIRHCVHLSYIESLHEFVGALRCVESSICFGILVGLIGLTHNVLPILNIIECFEVLDADVATGTEYTNE